MRLVLTEDTWLFINIAQLIVLVLHLLGDHLVLWYSLREEIGRWSADCGLLEGVILHCLLVIDIPSHLSLDNHTIALVYELTVSTWLRYHVLIRGPFTRVYKHLLALDIQCCLGIFYL